MPIPADKIQSSAYLRLLVLGGPKAGKTTTVIKSAPGFGYVINSDDEFSLRPATRFRTDFEYDLALGNEVQTIEKCIAAARKGVDAGTYSWVLWDTITKYGARVEDFFARESANAAGEPDGRRYWRNYRKHLHSVIDRLFMLKCHVIVTAHYIEQSEILIQGQLDKAGEGIVPMLGGAARSSIPAEFQDVVYLEKLPTGERKFLASSTGVWGPGCRNLPGVDKIDADIGKLWAKMSELNSTQQAIKSETKKQEIK